MVVRVNLRNNIYLNITNEGKMYYIYTHCVFLPLKRMARDGVTCWTFRLER